MHVSVSPDRGDGSRMSYLRFEDGTSGLDVFFEDVQGTSNPANFVETQIATGLNRAFPHTVKLTMDMYDGPSNDVVKVYIDGALVHTGTSWENYYRYDSEASAEQSPRIIKTVLWRSAGTANSADAGKVSCLIISLCHLGQFRLLRKYLVCKTRLPMVMI